MIIEFLSLVATLVAIVAMAQNSAKPRRPVSVGWTLATILA